MVVVRSYSPNGLIRPDPDYQLCCGLFHATDAAKFFAVVFLCLSIVISSLNFGLFGFEKRWLTVFCVICIIYCSILVYGVFSEKYSCLLPYLFIHGVFTFIFVIFIILLCIFGFSTDMIQNHHYDNVHLRDIYSMHDLNPDDANTQAWVAAVGLITAVLSCLVCMYSLYAVGQAYKCYKSADRTILPGFRAGIVAINEQDNEELL